MLGNRFGFEVSCECPDGYRTFIRFRDQNLVQQKRVFADKRAAVHGIGSYSAEKSRWF
jgi:hypothetical protein